MAGRGSKTAEQRMNKKIADLLGVQDALDDVQDRLYVQANARLSAHHDKGHAYIDKDEGDVDRYVVLVDPDGNALAIETGHMTREATSERYIQWHLKKYGYPPMRKRVEGLFIVTGLG